MIYKVITGRLLQHEAFDNLVKDRLFPVIIPQTRSFPAVSYNTIVATPDLTKDTTLQDTLTFQVSVFSTSYAEVYEVYEVIRDRLHRFEGIVNGVESRIILTSYRDQEIDTETGVYSTIMEFDAKMKL